MSKRFRMSAYEGFVVYKKYLLAKKFLEKIVKRGFVKNIKN